MAIDLSVPPLARTRSSIGESDLGRVSRLLLFINLQGLVWALASAATHAGPWTVWGCTVTATTIYLLGVRWSEPDPLKSLAMFGLAAGLTTLAVDWWLISGMGVLEYPDWGPFLVRSAGYMPVSWAGIVLTLGFAGTRVGQRFGALAGSLTTTLLTGTLIPFYELCAHFAGWWSYRGEAVFGVLPRYIIVGEILLGLPLAWLTGQAIERRRPRACLGLGVVIGLWIWASYAIGALITRGA